ncbi:MAG: SUMF1/EgtB/PvdO family nonheme iron enzyme [Alphaproteobacteria bacterium]|nr:SUMF1/EgtB/PvdO family nonheme iron enzyme [Alphaproteobacteria bacterium]
MTTVFINYRRDVCAGEARALFNELRQRLGEDSVFMDVDSIALGRDFRSALQKTLASCDLMLVLIGRNWTEVKDDKGRTRLDDPADFVRLEIETALKRDIVVTPVLVQGAHMPDPERLPPEMRDLVYRNGFELSHGRWESDLAEMIHRLNLGPPIRDGSVRQPASVDAASIAAIAPAKPRDRKRPGLIRLSRRQAVGIAATATLRTAAVIAVPAIRKLISKPALRTISFEVASVDEKGTRIPSGTYAAAAFTEAVGSSAGLDMISIPAGSFVMGSPADEPERQPNESPQHRVTLPPFFLGAAPVSQEQWAAVISAHPDRIRRYLEPNPSLFMGIDLPVETICWDDAEEFCLRLAAITGRPYRLPSEAEWEYACRAGTVTPFNVGPTITPDLANYCGTGGAVCGESEGKSIASDVYYGVHYTSGAYGQGPTGIFRDTTTPPGTFPRNRFGLFDMHGNVWEYCLDTVTDNYAEAPLDGSAYISGPPATPRILRGGSWSHNPAICRSAYRDGNVPSDPGWQGRCGVRVACTI